MTKPDPKEIVELALDGKLQEADDKLIAYFNKPDSEEFKEEEFEEYRKELDIVMKDKVMELNAQAAIEAQNAKTEEATVEAAAVEAVTAETTDAKVEQEATDAVEVQEAVTEGTASN